MPSPVIPNFFVVGVVKGGTTSLYHYLEQHPDIYLPPVKETNHFARGDIRDDLFLPEYRFDVDIDLDKYIAGGMKEQIHIAHVNDPEHYRALFSRRASEKAVGEISNSYMICPSAAKAIHNFNPQARIIVVLRNPIYRAWSQFLMNRRESKTQNVDFLSEVKQDAAAKDQGWGVSHQYLSLGHYASQLKPYIELFGRDKVLPLLFETYTRDPQRELDKICSFLGVSTGFNFDVGLQKNAASLPRFAKVNKFLVQSGAVRTAKRLVPKSARGAFAALMYSNKQLPKINPAEIEFLREYYQNEVAALSELTGLNVSEAWPEFSSNHLP